MTVFIFEESDEDYFEWLDANPEGFVVNSFRSPKTNYLVLHRSTCLSISKRNKDNPNRGGEYTQRAFIKICASSEDEIRSALPDILNNRNIKLDRDIEFSNRCSKCGMKKRSDELGQYDGSENTSTRGRSAIDSSSAILNDSSHVMDEANVLSDRGFRGRPWHQKENGRAGTEVRPGCFLYVAIINDEHGTTIKVGSGEKDDRLTALNYYRRAAQGESLWSEHLSHEFDTVEQARSAEDQIIRNAANSGWGSKDHGEFLIVPNLEDIERLFKEAVNSNQ